MWVAKKGIFKMKIGVGLVVKGGKQFLKDWIISAERIADVIFVIDNEADDIVKSTLIKHPKVKRYIIQKGLERNMSRDYQQILDLARDENCDWLWNIDIDEYIPEFDKLALKQTLLNVSDTTIGFPLLEMRGDRKHYVMVKDKTKELKDCRLVHKCYKVLSHFAYNLKDKHGSATPHNCICNIRFIPIVIQHYGHMTKELRDEKRERGKEGKDNYEHKSTWMEEDETKLTIKHISELKL